VAIDPNVTRTDPEVSIGSPIENEIPAYRAISPLAIASLMLGALSILSFAHWFFLSFAVAALVLGFLADRKINRFSDVLTGRGFAQAGIGLGLIFGLASVTTGAVQGYLRSSSATRFATAYAQVLQDKSVEDALWYQAPPEERKKKTPGQVAKEMREGMPDPGAFEMQTGPIRELKNRLAKDKDTKLRFSKLESHGVDGLTTFAAALLELTEPDAKHAHGDEYAMILLKADNTKGQYEWRVEEFQYPYKPASYVPAAKPVDDGHGHAH
jgi:prepilin signal peptidase PulO-like enzyme (type II secretory pathway)